MSVLRMSKAAASAIARAEASARALGHGRLEAIHLVLGVVEVDAPLRAALVAVASEALSNRLRAAASDVYDGPRAGEGPGFERGDEAALAIAEAVEEADAAGSFEVEPAHIFLAATASEASSAYRALEALAVDVERARRAVLRALAARGGEDADGADTGPGAGPGSGPGRGGMESPS